MSSIKKLESIFNEDFILKKSAIEYSTKEVSLYDQLITELISEKENILIIEKLFQSHLARYSNSFLCSYIMSVFYARLKDSQCRKWFKQTVFFYKQAKKNNHIVSFCRNILSYYELIDAVELLLETNYEKDEEEELDLLIQVVKLTKKEKYINRLSKLYKRLKKWTEYNQIEKQLFKEAILKKDEIEIINRWNAIIDLGLESFEYYYENGQKILPILELSLKKLVFDRILKDNLTQLNIPYLLQRNYSKIDKNVDHLDENPLSDVNQDTHSPDLETCFQQSIDVLKFLLNSDVYQDEYNDIIYSLYKKRYYRHNKLNDYLKYSGLEENRKNTLEKLLKQMQLFEDLIRFDIGAYVFHRSFGYGVIKDLFLPSSNAQDILVLTKIKINFEKKQNHIMTLRIALSSLNHCESSNAICIILFNKDKVFELKQKKPSDLLESLLKSVNKPISLEELKKTFVPNLFSLSEWDKQWEKMKKCVTKNSIFEQKNKLLYLKPSQDKNQQLLLRKIEKIKDSIATQNVKKSFTDFIKTINIYLNTYTLEKDDNLFSETLILIIKNIDKELKEKNDTKIYNLNSSSIDDYLLAVNFLICYYLKKKNFIFKEINFFDIWADYFSTYNLLNIYLLTPTEYHSDSFDFIVKQEKNWDKLVLDLFITSPSNDIYHHINQEINQSVYLFMLEKLQKEKKVVTLQKIIDTLLDNPEIYYYGFIITAKFLLYRRRNQSIQLDKSTLFKKLVQGLNNYNKDIVIGKNLTTSKKNYQQTLSLLFSGDNLFTYLEDDQEDLETRKQIIQTLEGYSFLDNYLKTSVREIIINH